MTEKLKVLNGETLRKRLADAVTRRLVGVLAELIAEEKLIHFTKH